MESLCFLIRRQTRWDHWIGSYGRKSGQNGNQTMGHTNISLIIKDREVVQRQSYKVLVTRQSLKKYESVKFKVI